jgi:hypothetical protein
VSGCSSNEWRTVGRKVVLHTTTTHHSTDNIDESANRKSVSVWIEDRHKSVATVYAPLPLEKRQTNLAGKGKTKESESVESSQSHKSYLYLISVSKLVAATYVEQLLRDAGRLERARSSTAYSTVHVVGRLCILEKGVNDKVGNGSVSHRLLAFASSIGFVRSKRAKPVPAS